MSKLLWDEVGSRFYEAGLDRGVLYLSDGSGVAWSGLVSVEEDFGGDDTSPTFFDGVKTRDTPSGGDFSATLTALTYPEEFEEYNGSGSLSGGLFVDDQASKSFGLSYRTRVGNDTESTDFGYKIHIVYNALASSDSTTRETQDNSTTPITFDWSLSSTPQEVSAYRPTAHIIFDTRELPLGLLAEIEAILYGTNTEEPRQPTIDELIGVAKLWGPRIIVPDSISGLSQLIQGVGDLTPSALRGLYTAVSDSRLSPTAISGLYQLV